MFNEKDAADDASFVTALYQSILKRDPEPLGLAHCLEGLRAGTFNRIQLIESFLHSDEFHAINSIKDQSNSPRHNMPNGCTATEALAIFKRWKPYTGPGLPGYVTNFLGCVTDVRFVINLEHLSGAVEGYPIPGNFHGDTLEWMGVLKSVLEADSKFSMIELGAGWGPWCAIGYKAAKRRGINHIRVAGVEGDPGHVRFMRESFAKNALPDADTKIIAGVVGVKDGQALFPKVKDASKAYGGAAAFDETGQTQSPFSEFIASQAPLIDEVERVSCYSLDSLTNDLSVVDLIHSDIQGEEANLFQHAIDLVSAKVKRLVIGTHSCEIDRLLINLFPRHGWILEAADACIMDEHNGIASTYRDGTQVWRNSKFAGSNAFFDVENEPQL